MTALPSEVITRCGVLCAPRRPVPPAYLLQPYATTAHAAPAAANGGSGGGGGGAVGAAAAAGEGSGVPEAHYGYCAPTKTGHGGDCAEGDSG